MGRGWACVKKFNSDISAILQDIDTKILNNKIDVCILFARYKALDEVYDLEEDEKKSPFEKAMDALDKEGDPSWANVKGIVLLLSGEPILILDYMKQTNRAPNDLIDILTTVMKLLSMNEEKFKRIAGDTAQTATYVDILRKHFISPIINYIRTMLQARMRLLMAY